MEKSRRIFKRRDFIRTGILGSAVLSSLLGHSFFSSGTPLVPGVGEQVTATGIPRSEVFNITRKYGAEFGAIKPVVRRH
jgi:hypothetical protein